jgi:endonuclease-3 related protein
MELYGLMLSHFGPQHWWPGETALEVMVGAVLTQNTNWKNVEKAISRLKAKGLLSLKSIHKLSTPQLADEIKSSGYYQVKARRLKNLISFIMEHYEGALSSFLTDEMEKQRSGLLKVKGIGEETADSILLYAANRPTFVVDTYTYRLLCRHGMAPEAVTYGELQAIFMDNLPADPELFNEFHALIVRTGKAYCRKNTPRCELCPLREWGDVGIR